MKENEAPERIYCESDGLGNIVKVHNIKWPDDEAENIEYTRTDAFIDKAEEFINSALNDSIMGTANIENFMRLFKKYLKGE